MRALILIPALALAACNVSKDAGNDSTTVSFNSEIAENAIDDAGNTAGNIAEDVGNTVEDAGNAIDNTDIDIDGDDGNANDQANAAATNSN